VLLAAHRAAADQAVEFGSHDDVREVDAGGRLPADASAAASSLRVSALPPRSASAMTSFVRLAAPTSSPRER
jgi:hypothetical protein